MESIKFTLHFSIYKGVDKLIKKVVSSFLSDTQKYRILINKVDEMSGYQLDSIISRRGGIDSFGIFLSL